MDRRHEKRQRRAHRKAKRPLGLEPTPPVEPLQQLAAGFNEPHPVVFLSHTSTIWEALADAGSSPSLMELLPSLLEVTTPQTTALLLAFREFASDRFLVTRIDHELGTRRHRLPDWLQNLSGVVPTRVARQAEPFEDGSQYWVELTWPSGQSLSLGALVDANWGQALKDLMVVPDRIDVVEAILEQHAEPGNDMVFEEIAPADLRARVTQAISLTDVIWPPVETESWPSGRTLLTWALAKLPDGGVGFPEPLDDKAQRALRDEFLASPSARHLGPHAAHTAESLIWFADYGCGDPLRWSPIKIQLLMTDWWHRKVIQDANADRAMPAILRAFVTWSGERTRLDDGRLAQNLATIDQFEPEFLANVDAPRRGTAHHLARLAAGLPLNEDADANGWFDVGDDGLVDMLAAQVGGHNVLESLTADPLPDEQFDEGGIAPDILPTIRKSLGLFLDIHEGFSLPCSDELRTVAFRAVRRMALADPALWRRRAAPASTAYVIAHLVYEMNELLYKRVPAKDLLAALRLKTSPQPRVAGFQRALLPGPVRIDPTLMTSEARAGLIATRERWRELDESELDL